MWGSVVDNTKVGNGRRFVWMRWKVWALVVACPLVLLALGILGTQLMNDWRLKRWSELPFSPITALGVHYEVVASGRFVEAGPDGGGCLFKAYHVLYVWGFPQREFEEMRNIVLPSVSGNLKQNTKKIDFQHIKYNNFIIISLEYGPFITAFDFRCM